jgi:isoquinoline 1-oxidoreductase alpha subunit
MIALNINGKVKPLGEIDPDTPLLWALRDTLGLVGTKYGCGIAQCGACTVLVDGRPSRACLLRVGQLQGKQVTTIEGLAAADGSLSALQQAWIDYDVPQCGYCQAGQLMSATALLNSNPNPTDGEIQTAMSGNYCRCGTYGRIVGAIKSVVAKSAKIPATEPRRARGA